MADPSPAPTPLPPAPPPAMPGRAGRPAPSLGATEALSLMASRPVVTTLGEAANRSGKLMRRASSGEKVPPPPMWLEPPTTPPLPSPAPPSAFENGVEGTGDGGARGEDKGRGSATMPEEAAAADDDEAAAAAAAAAATPLLRCRNLDPPPLPCSSLLSLRSSVSSSSPSSFSSSSDRSLQSDSSSSLLAFVLKGMDTPSLWRAPSPPPSPPPPPKLAIPPPPLSASSGRLEGESTPAGLSSAELGRPSSLARSSTLDAAELETLVVATAAASEALACSASLSRICLFRARASFANSFFCSALDTSASHATRSASVRGRGPPGLAEHVSLCRWMDLVEVVRKNLPQRKGQFHRSCAANSYDLRRVFCFRFSLLAASCARLPSGGLNLQSDTCLWMLREDEVRYVLPQGVLVSGSMLGQFQVSCGSSSSVKRRRCWVGRRNGLPSASTRTEPSSASWKGGPAAAPNTGPVGFECKFDEEDGAGLGLEKIEGGEAAGGVMPAPAATVEGTEGGG